MQHFVVTCLLLAQKKGIRNVYFENTQFTYFDTFPRRCECYKSRLYRCEVVFFCIFNNLTKSAIQLELSKVALTVYGDEIFILLRFHCVYICFTFLGGLSFFI